jgi:hypothetical protein
VHTRHVHKISIFGKRRHERCHFMSVPAFGSAETTLFTSAVAADGEALGFWGGIKRLAGKWDNRVCSRVVIIGVWCNSAEGKA